MRGSWHRNRGGSLAREPSRQANVGEGVTAVRRANSPAEIAIFAGLVLIGLLLGQAQTRARNVGKADLVTSLLQRLVLPPAQPIRRILASGDSLLSGIGKVGPLQAKVQRLSDEVRANAMYGENIARLQTEIDDLRKLQGFAALPGHQSVPAEVIALFAFDNRLTLSAGADKGVEAGMPVVTGRGLLGIVQTVGPTTCQALLLTSPASQIGAIALRNPPAAGLMRGETAGTLSVEFLDPKAAVDTGDDVATSGFSAKIPRGLPIGRIIRLEDNPDFGTKRGIVFPWAILGTVREAYILK